MYKSGDCAHGSPQASQPGSNASTRRQLDGGRQEHPTLRAPAAAAPAPTVELGPAPSPVLRPPAGREQAACRLGARVLHRSGPDCAGCILETVPAPGRLAAGPEFRPPSLLTGGFLSLSAIEARDLPAQRPDVANTTEYATGWPATSESKLGYCGGFESALQRCSGDRNLAMSPECAHNPTRQSQKRPCCGGGGP